MQTKEAPPLTGNAYPRLPSLTRAQGSTRETGLEGSHKKLEEEKKKIIGITPNTPSNPVPYPSMPTLPSLAPADTEHLTHNRNQSMPPRTTNQCSWRGRTSRASAPA